MNAQKPESTSLISAIGNAANGNAANANGQQGTIVQKNNGDMEDQNAYVPDKRRIKGRMVDINEFDDKLYNDTDEMIHNIMDKNPHLQQSIVTNLVQTPNAQLQPVLSLVGQTANSAETPLQMRQMFQKQTEKNNLGPADLLLAAQTLTSYRPILQKMGFSLPKIGAKGLKMLASLDKMSQSDAAHYLQETPLAMSTRAPKQYEYPLVQNVQFYTDQYGKDRMGLTSEEVKASSALQSFPQWAIRRKKQVQDAASKQKAAIDLLDGVRDKNSKFYSAISRIDPDAYHWDQQRQQWRGFGVDQSLKKVGDQKTRRQNAVAKSNELLATKLTQQQIDQQIPEVVKQIVDANTALSKMGFGAVSTARGSLNLFAGRWLDQATGRIRVLPTATTKYLNPASLKQKIGYLQAKVLNHWNNTVTSIEEYNRAKTLNQTQYKTQVMNSIKNSVQVSTMLFAQVNMINRRINQVTQLLFLNGRNQALLKNPGLFLVYCIPEATRAEIYQQVPGTIKDDEVNRLNVSLVTGCQIKVGMWNRALNTAIVTALSIVDSDKNLSNIEKQRTTYQLQRAFVSLTAGASRRIGAALKKLQKIAAIPNSITASQMVDVAQKVDAAQDDISKATQTFSTGAISREYMLQFEQKALKVIPAIKNGGPKAAKSIESFVKNAGMALLKKGAVQMKQAIMPKVGSFFNLANGEEARKALKY